MSYKKEAESIMTLYQELQLNQAGSKQLIRSTKDKREKARHIAIYFFKIFITLVFCVAFVTVYSKVFGDDNSIVGVVVLLSVMAFRFADFGIHAPHAVSSLLVIWGIMTFGPRLANAGNLVTELLVNVGCIFVLMILGCHNVVMFNQSTLLLGYLLLYGYDVSGTAYIQRVLGMILGGALTGIVFYRNHKNQTYKRTLRHIFEEFDLSSSRTRWQICVTLGVSSVIFLAGLFGLPRAMWVGIAAMSVLVPFHEDMKGRIKGRIPGNILGGLTFIVLYLVLPESMYSLIGILGGIGVGLSATYGWQAVFNSWGAMSIAMSFLGVGGAIFFRIFNNALGALYALAFYKVFSVCMDRAAAGAKKRVSRI